MSEYLDLFNESGHPTGERKLKDEVHRDGDRHKTVHGWVMDQNGALLIQRRSVIKQNHPNMWDVSFAGHIFAGENSLYAALRESKEELGLDIRPEQLQYLFTVENRPITLNNGTYIDYEIQDVYLLRLDGRPNFKLQAEEVAETKWLPWQELKSVVDSKDPAFVLHTEEYKKLFEFLKNHEN